MESPAFSEMGGYDRKRGVEPPGFVGAVIQTGIEAAFAVSGGEIHHRSVHIGCGGCRRRVDGGYGDWAHYEIITVYKLSYGHRLAEGPGDAVLGN